PLRNFGIPPNDGRDVTVTINGTAGNDAIVVNYSPPPVLTLARTRALGRFAGDIFGRSTLTEITVNGVKTTANIPLSQRIVINGLDGDDKITVIGNHAVDAHGDKGNDTITGGSGADTIWGGWNDDVLR